MSGPPDPADERQVLGMASAVGAFLIWGLIPILFKAIADVPAVEIVAHRIVWAAVLMAVLAAAGAGRRRVRAALANPRTMGALAISAVAVAVNWLVFIWAVNHDRVLETSLGYFMNPLVNVVFGVAFLGERLRPVQWAAVALAATGVAVMALGYGALPWVALTLAVSFGLYGLVRKVTPIDAISGLWIETLMLAPAALGYLLWLGRAGEGVFLVSGIAVDGLLVATGIATAVPLMLFAVAARRIRLVTLGFIQYLAPSTSFLLGVFLFREPFTPVLQATFSFVWAGLALYSMDAARRRGG